jgi:hypothetical protein
MLEYFSTAIIGVNLSFLFAYWKGVTPKTKKYLEFQKKEWEKRWKTVRTGLDMAEMIDELSKIKKIQRKFSNVCLVLGISTTFAILTFFVLYLSPSLEVLTELPIALAFCAISAFYLIVAFLLTIQHMIKLHQWDMSTT